MKYKRKNSQASREGGLVGTSPENVYTQVALKPEVQKSKSRSRDPNPNAGVKRIPQATTLSAGKISRQNNTTTSGTHETLSNQ